MGEVPGLLEVLGVVECTEEIFLLGWRFNTEIGSAHLPGYCMPSPGKTFHRTSVTVPCTQFHVLNQKYFSNTQHYAVCTCTIGSCMPSNRLRRPQRGNNYEVIVLELWLEKLSSSINCRKCSRFEILTFKVLHCNIMMCHVLFTQNYALIALIS